MTGIHLMTNPAEIETFALAGNATLTLKSLKSDRWFTYKIQQGEDRNGKPAQRWFVKVLTQGDQYVYVGMIGPQRDFGRSHGSKLSDDAPSMRAFGYFWSHLSRGKAIAPDLEVRHHNHCGRCGRELTVPESIDTGLGPDCRRIMGLDA